MRIGNNIISKAISDPAAFPYHILTGAVVSENHAHDAIIMKDGICYDTVILLHDGIDNEAAACP